MAANHQGELGRAGVTGPAESLFESGVDDPALLPPEARPATSRGKVRLCRTVFVVLFPLAAALLLVATVRACWLMASGAASPSAEHFLVIDAGSTKTMVFVIRRGPEDDKLEVLDMPELTAAERDASPGLEWKDGQYQVKPALATYVSSAGAGSGAGSAADPIRRMLQAVCSKLPGNGPYPLFLWGTAGLREVHRNRMDDTDDLLETLQEALEALPQVEVENLTVISGRREAWLAHWGVMKALGSEHVGIFEVGGSSMQLAFGSAAAGLNRGGLEEGSPRPGPKPPKSPPTEPLAGPQGSRAAAAPRQGPRQALDEEAPKPLPLFLKSWSGCGATKILEASAAELAAEGRGGPGPCHHEAYDEAACEEHVRAVIDRSGCSFSDMPPAAELPEFRAIGHPTFVAEELGLLGGEEKLLRAKDFSAKAKEICPKEPEKKEDKFARHNCFFAHYYAQLLPALGLADGAASVVYGLTIGGTKPFWPVGALERHLLAQRRPSAGSAAGSAAHLGPCVHPIFVVLVGLTCCCGAAARWLVRKQLDAAKHQRPANVCPIELTQINSAN